MINKIKQWLALLKAKKEEKKHLPSKEEIEEENKEFMGKEVEADKYFIKKKNSGNSKKSQKTKVSSRR